MGYVRAKIRIGSSDGNATRTVESLADKRGIEADVFLVRIRILEREEESNTLAWGLLVYNIAEEGQVVAYGTCVCRGLR